ncbi:MAG: SpoIIE family protein phosphatase, partial [Bacteroidales bacterium]|nr:SpoIIE family protein phosphatase [Bacteroidales bacterium]
ENHRFTIYMLKSIKFRLLFWFVFISLLAIGIQTLVTIVYFNKKEKITNLVYKTESNYIMFLEDLNDINGHFAFDTKSNNYHNTGKSQYLDRHKEKFLEIENKITEISSEDFFKDYNLDNIIEKITDLLTKKENTLDSLVILIKERGFRDFGTEGRMRKHIHQLEKYKNLDQTLVLTIRRHEKDFIIRHDTVYIEKLLKTCVKLKDDIDIKYQEKEINDSLSLELKKYIAEFKKVVILDSLSGVYTNSGLKSELDQLSNEIKAEYELLIQETKISKELILHELKWYYFVLTGIIIIIGILLSLLISNNITMPLIKLSGIISRFVSSQFTNEEHIAIKSTNDEIELLNRNFIVLRTKIIEQLKNLEQKVEERTKEITSQKNKITAQKEEITAQRDKLEMQKSLIQKQKETAETQNKNMIDSIVYAKRIQDAMLQNNKYINEIIPDYFILFKPKDIVSGDFYWVNQVVTKKQTISYVAAVDCTGHGVPGAFMSLLGNNALNQAVNDQCKISTAHIVSYLNQNIFKTLHKDVKGNFIRDGMDIALCSINFDTMILEFTGTYNPLYIVRNKKIIEVKGDNIPLGVSLEDGRKIKKHKKQLQKDDMIYIFTDGYVDQFGGETPNGKKFKFRRFREILERISVESTSKQKEILDDTIEKWMCPLNNQQNHEQVDDILVIGIRV